MDARRKAIDLDLILQVMALGLGRMLLIGAPWIGELMTIGEPTSLAAMAGYI
jgi:hypothetical protein